MEEGFEMSEGAAWTYPLQQGQARPTSPITVRELTNA